MGDVTVREIPPANAPAKESTKARFNCPESSIHREPQIPRPEARKRGRRDKSRVWA